MKRSWLGFRCRARYRFGKSVPAMGREGKRLDFADFALHRKRFPPELKIERTDVARLDNDLLPSAERFFRERSHGFLGGHFPIHINGYPCIFSRPDFEDQVARICSFGT